MSLEFVPSDDLVEELKRRYDACIVARLEDRGGEEVKTFDFGGGLTPCVGLCELMKQALMDPRRRAEFGEGDER